jgi:CBS domain-containing protein
MGDQRIERASEADALLAFKKHLLNDLMALERLIAAGRIERDIHRIGAEQETCLVDAHFRPAYANLDILAELDREHFTTELGRFNIELNLDPQDAGPTCLESMERQLEELLATLREAAARREVRVLLAGILPTLSMSDLSFEGMTPLARYRAINDAMTRLSGGEYRFRIKGLDELLIRHHNVMLEACCTSFQVHLQVSAEEFPRFYNAALAIAAPTLAVGANSPILFGRRLWRESRIALFQQAIDTRQGSTNLREQQARVSFGSGWMERSVLEIFREDVARFPALLAAPVDEDSLAVVAGGGVPQLRALRLFNGTVYRWMRPCYGISASGAPHLRIENRILPAGPSVLDQMANAALWLGLMRGLPEACGDIAEQLEFDTAHENFVSAARLGIHSQLSWPGHPNVPAPELVGRLLLPIAHRGLELLGLTSASAERYLGVIAERVARGRTGSLWQLESWASFGKEGSRAERAAALTGSMLRQQASGRPVHEWSLARLEEAGAWQPHYSRVEQLMSTELFAVHEGELVDLVAAMMNWRHIRHVPVEDEQHRLVGLVTYRTLLEFVARGSDPTRAVPVSEVMVTGVHTIAPTASTVEALELMREHKLSCLPVIEDEKLVGMITERDFLRLAHRLFLRELSGP